MAAGEELELRLQWVEEDGTGQVAFLGECLDRERELQSVYRSRIAAAESRVLAAVDRLRDVQAVSDSLRGQVAELEADREGAE